MRFRDASGRVLVAAMLVVCGGWLSGCVKEKVVMRVGKDGSGRILVTRLFPRETAEQVAAMMQETTRAMAMAGAGAEFVPKAADPFFNEKSIRKDARSFGPSVRYVQARPVRVGGMRGYVALYRFKDINEVSLDLSARGRKLADTGALYRMDGEEDVEGADEEESGRSDSAYGFRFSAGSPARLTIAVPNPAQEEMEEEAADGESEADDTDEGEDETVSEMADLREAMEFEMAAGETRSFVGSRIISRMVSGADGEMDMQTRMLKGLELSFAVEVDGKPVKSTATYRDPGAENRTVLVDVNMDKIVSDPDARKKMGGGRMYGYMMSPGSLSAFAKLPSVRIETNREVVVEFN